MRQFNFPNHQKPSHLFNNQLFTKFIIQLSNQLTHHLFNLIKELSKAEKRHFRLYANRNFSNKQSIFIQLFDLIDKMSTYDDQKVLAAFPQLKMNALSNHKANLYEQLLISLRLLYHQKPAIRITELISFSQVLHQKGLYKQSLNQLGKARQLAIKYSLEHFVLEITEIEKQIELHYVTRSHDNRANELIDTAVKTRDALYTEGLWADLALKMYDRYLKSGHSKNKEEFEGTSNFFHSNLPIEITTDVSFYGKVYKLQSYIWYNYINQNFAQCYRHSKSWIHLFDEYPQIKVNDPEIYMKGIHNCLSSLFYCDEAKRFQQELIHLEEFITENATTFNDNQSTLAFVYLETAKINYFFLEGQFTEGAAYCSEFEQKMKNYESKLDPYRILVFHYKMACLKFGCDDYKGSIKYLNFIINNQKGSLREDIQCFARILNLIAHFELGNDELIDYQIKSSYRFLLKMKDMQKVQVAVFQFLKKSVYMNRKELTPHFAALKNELDQILSDKFERRSILYLDIISWLESKLNGQSVEAIIKEKKQLRLSR